MKPHLRLATLILLGAVPLAGMSADTGSSSGSTSTPGGMSGPSAQPDTSDAQTSQVPAQFRRLDKNKDGMISKDEAKRSKEVSARFDEIDTDHDGKISLSEWKAANVGTGAAGVSGESRERHPSDTSSPGMGTPGPGSPPPGPTRQY